MIIYVDWTVLLLISLRVYCAAAARWHLRPQSSGGLAGLAEKITDSHAWHLDKDPGRLGSAGILGLLNSPSLHGLSCSLPLHVAFPGLCSRWISQQGIQTSFVIAKGSQKCKSGSLHALLKLSPALAVTGEETSTSFPDRKCVIKFQPCLKPALSTP